MTYLITYTSPWSPIPQQCAWVCLAPMDTVKALELFKARNTSATVLSIAECAGRGVDK